MKSIGVLFVEVILGAATFIETLELYLKIISVVIMAVVGIFSILANISTIRKNKRTRHENN